MFVLHFSNRLMFDVCSSVFEILTISIFYTLNTSIYVTLSATVYSVRMGVLFLFPSFVSFSIFDCIKPLLNPGIVFIILALMELLRQELTYESTSFPMGMLSQLCLLQYLVTSSH